jgi:hypothetical protein
MLCALIIVQRYEFVPVGGAWAGFSARQVAKLFEDFLTSLADLFESDNHTHVGALKKTDHRVR